jgi:large subunit ribosomal protein L24
VQTTLLSFAIGLIAALLIALVGPLFIDWTSYRAEFEARASRLTGLDFHITGPVDARLLPTPTLVLHGVELARPGDKARARVRALRVEFALGALVRGDWRIADARLEAPEVVSGLDPNGLLDWPAPKIAFAPEEVAIERLSIEDGRVTLRDAAAGAQLVLDKLEFRGELRSFSGPIKGEGSFVAGGHHFPYRVSMSRIDQDSGAKLRLALDPIDQPLTAELDVAISLDRGVPRFEGNVQLARPVGRAPEGSQSPIVEPWRLVSHVKGDSRAAVFDALEFQYGPDERATKLRGFAHWSLGSEQRIEGELSSTHVDLDRLLALPERARRYPAAAFKKVADAFSATYRLSVPATLNIKVDSLDLAGATLQRLEARLETDGERPEIRSLEFRAPGVTQVHLHGRLGTNGAGIEFAGSTQMESSDPRTLLSWLTDHVEADTILPGTLRLSGDVTLSNESIAIERFDLGLDRMTASGRLVYSWGNGTRPPRLDAVLSAPEVDLDRLQVLANAIAAGTMPPWPREGALSLKIGRASVLGVAAKQVDVSMRIDANGVQIDPLMIADFGGATVGVRGRIDTSMESPRGAMTFDIDARALDGVLAVAEKFSPQTAESIRRFAGRLTPAVLRASITVDPGAVSSPHANARFKADGRAGNFRLALLGDAVTPGDAFKQDKIAALAAAKVNLIGRIEADDGAALVELTGLDRFIAVEKRPARLTLTTKGVLDGEVELSGQFAAGTLAVSTSGKARLSFWKDPRADLELKITNANLRSPRPVVEGEVAQFLPASLTARLNLTDGTIRLSDIKGSIAGSAVSGALTIGMPQRPISINGEIDLANIDLAAAVATVAGIPAYSAAGKAGTGMSWPSEPFEHVLAPMRGEVAIRFARIALRPKLEAHDVKGVVHFDDSQIAVQLSEGSLAGGRLAGEVALLHDREGLAARTRIELSGANAADLLPGDGAVSGRLGFDLSAQGSGMSAVALVGSLEGRGTFALENARLARLDPRVFDAVIRAVDQGLPIDANRLRERAEAALKGGALAIERAEGAIAISAGQARLANSVADAHGTELALNGSLGLTDGEIDTRLTLSGAPASAGPEGTRPQIIILLKGPFDAPTRSLDVSSLASWLALRAVEQQSKKLDVLESRESSAAPITSDNPAPAPKPLPQTAPADHPAPPTQRVQSRPSKPPKAPAGELARPLPPVEPRPEFMPLQRLFGVQ